MSKTDEIFKIEISGMEELLKNITALGLSIEEVNRAATEEAAAVIVREGKLNSERGGDEFPHRITGNLMRSIKIMESKTVPGGYEVIVGSAMKYAARLEYGFVDTDSLGRKYNQAARPYLRPAMDEHKEEILNAYRLRFASFLK